MVHVYLYFPPIHLIFPGETSKIQEAEEKAHSSPLILQKPIPMSSSICLSPPISLLPPTLSSLPENLFSDLPQAVRLLNSAATQTNLRLAASVHAGLLKSGLHSNLFVGNSLLDAYLKCDHLDAASKLFDQMPLRDVITWTTLIAGNCISGSAVASISVFLSMLSDQTAPPPNEFTVAAVLRAFGMVNDENAGRMVHGYIITTGFIQDVFVANSLIDMYTKIGLVADAEKFLKKLSCRDVVSWTAVISGFVLHGMFENALVVFEKMLKDGVFPNIATMLSIIQACSLIGASTLFNCIHAWVVKLELAKNILVVKSLVEMYAKNAFFNETMKIFINFYLSDGYEHLEPDLVAAVIRGCALAGCYREGGAIHGYILKTGFLPCTVVANSLIDLYAKHKKIDSSYAIFTRMKNRDIVSWNTIISCFVKNDRADEALQHLSEVHGMTKDKLVPDPITMQSSLQACSAMAALRLGQILNGYVVRSGHDCDVFICNSLIDMYGKSGRLDCAEQVFKEMKIRDLGSYNSMIATYGIHGDGNSALRIFAELKSSGQYDPNAITFLNVISACAHSGLTIEGYKCFKSMQRDYAILPSIEHYAAIVDLLGRSGKLDDAEQFIEQMPIEADSSVWGSLLGACGLHGNVRIAEKAAQKLAILQPDSSIWRVALANVYALAGKWAEASEVRSDIKREGSRKEAGWSYVELGSTMNFRFTVGGTSHPEAARIFQVCRSIKDHITDDELTGSF